MTSKYLSIDWLGAFIWNSKRRPHGPTKFGFLILRLNGKEVPVDKKLEVVIEEDGWPTITIDGERRYLSD